MNESTTKNQITSMKDLGHPNDLIDLDDLGDLKYHCDIIDSKDLHDSRYLKDHNY